MKTAARKTCNKRSSRLNSPKPKRRRRATKRNFNAEAGERQDVYERITARIGQEGPFREFCTLRTTRP